MPNIENKEIKGISAKNLIWLLSSVVIIEFTIIMKYNMIMNNLDNIISHLNNIEVKQNKHDDKIQDNSTDIKILKTELGTYKMK